MLTAFLLKTQSKIPIHLGKKEHHSFYSYAHKLLRLENLAPSQVSYDDRYTAETVVKRREALIYFHHSSYNFTFICWKLVEIGDSNNTKRSSSKTTLKVIDLLCMP